MRLLFDCTEWGTTTTQNFLPLLPGMEPIISMCCWMLLNYFTHLLTHTWENRVCPLVTRLDAPKISILTPWTGIFSGQPISHSSFPISSAIPRSLLSSSISLTTCHCCLVVCSCRWVLFIRYFPIEDVPGRDNKRNSKEDTRNRYNNKIFSRNSEVTNVRIERGSCSCFWVVYIRM